MHLPYLPLSLLITLLTLVAPLSSWADIPPTEPVAPSTAEKTEKTEKDVQASLRSRKVVRGVIMTRAAEYQKCYERVLETQPTLGGSITVVMKVSPSGQVLLARVDPSDLGAEVDECILKHIRQLKFPKVEGGKVVRIRYPFRFKSGRSSSSP